MLDTIKCCLFSMGVGIVVGAMITANNKKIQSVAKEAQEMAEEKIEEAKEGINKIKTQIEKKSKKQSKPKESTQKNISK